MDVLDTFIPPDRRWALARNETLQDRANGAVLFADVSGFTPLTEAMTQMVGVRRGAEQLTQQLNRVYDALIAQIENYGGSVITFAGDAALCWFPESPLAAVACAFALQEAMKQFRTVPLPNGTTTVLAIKVTVAYGRVRRFVVGDPQIRQIDTIAGNTVARTAVAEHLAHPGEILIDAATAEILDAQMESAEWRADPITHQQFAVLRIPHQTFSAQRRFPTPQPPNPTPPLSDETIKPWLHAAVLERTRAKGELFLTELRPVVAVFVRFHGIDFEEDDAAGEKLDRFIARVQQTLTRYDGSLLELTIGDKGSYFYATFGALHIHEDDARRAVLAARELFPLCSELGFIEPLQIGISQGVMRVGAYGSATRRMYGAQGDEVNLAARLMTEAAPGTVLISGRVQKIVVNEFDLEPMPPIRLKGKVEPLLPFRVQGLRETRVQQLQEAYYSLPMIGREREFALIQEKLERARRGQGQIVGVTARAGMGKSRLTAEIIRAVRRQRESSYGGECQSFGTNVSYLVWTPIWRAFFGLDANLPLRRQIRALENELNELVPERFNALPLLGTVLQLPIPENDFTRALEPEYRKSVLYALLLDCVRAAARDARGEGHALLFVIEDAHWIDPASRELLKELAANIDSLPVLLLLNYRPPEMQADLLGNIRARANFTEIALGELSDQQGEGLVRAKLAQHAPESGESIPRELMTRVIEQAQGNPFYIEQLLDYMHDRGINFRDPSRALEIELPNTLHRLVLSRIDQLNERQQLTLKAASIIGRWFILAHLCGYFPRVGSPDQVHADLVLLQSYDLMMLDQPDPSTSSGGIAYLFKHVVTHQVAYESLPYSTQAMLHEAYAHFLEGQDPARFLDTIAFHYDQSENLSKRREFLRRAGQAAAARFANVEAVDYFTRALAITPKKDLSEQYELLSAREHVFEVQGEREKQRADLASLEELARELDDSKKQLDVMVKQAWLAERMTDHAAATHHLQQITNTLAHTTLAPNARVEIETDLALLNGVILSQQGNAVQAKPFLEQALELARESENRTAQARAQSILGVVERDLGDFASAKSHFQEQLMLAHTQHDRRHEWAALNNLGLIANARGDYTQAVENYSQGLAIVREIGDRMGEGIILSNLALAAMDQGEYDGSREWSSQALPLAHAISNRRSVCQITLNLGEAARLLGDYATAYTETERALALARELGDRLIEEIALTNLSALALDQNDLERARNLVEQALPLSREIGHRDGEGFLLNALGQVQLAEGEIENAQTTFHDALKVWETLEPLAYALDAHAGLAEIALRRDDLANAQAHVEKILAYLDTHPAQRGAPSALNGSLTAFRVLERANDPRARPVLQSAHEALQARAGKISDETQRRSFLENVRVNRELQRVSAALAR